jgi:DNA helicase MCM9
LERSTDDRNAARTTIRMFEGVIRLSQAHAKLMMRDKVIVMDAVIAIILIECSINKIASFGDVNILHAAFPSDAENEYKNYGLIFFVVFIGY